VTIRNDGDADLVIDDLQASAGFDVTATTCPAAPQALPPAGGSCTVDVVFEPLEARTALGELSVTYNGAKTAAMTLRGTGVSPSGAITPASITFPPTQVGVASAPVSVTVRSTAALPLILGTAAVTGDAELGSDGCSGTTLAHQNDTCTLELRFVPTAVGSRTGTLTVPTDGLPATLTVSANGIGS